MTMAEVRIDMETTLYEQMAALCAKFGTTVEAMAVRFCEEFVRMGTPPVPEPYASMSVEDKIDFIALSFLLITCAPFFDFGLCVLRDFPTA